MTPGTKEYIGDGVYVSWDGYHVVLTTENGIETTNTIYLEPSVQIELVKFFEKIVK
jgi:hypothetical protein